MATKARGANTRQGVRRRSFDRLRRAVPGRTVSDLVGDSHDGTRSAFRLWARQEPDPGRTAGTCIEIATRSSLPASRAALLAYTFRRRARLVLTLLPLVLSGAIFIMA